MEDVRLDAAGELRCWNCGARSFTEEHTKRARRWVGGLHLAYRPKKLRCNRCGKYNDRDAKPYQGPASKEYRPEWEAEAAAAVLVALPPPEPRAFTGPGWYPDPLDLNGARRMRWHDGRAWAEHTAPS